MDGHQPHLRGPQSLNDRNTPNSPTLVHVAIDFGTSRTGIAFCIKSTDVVPDDVHVVTTYLGAKKHIYKNLSDLFLVKSEVISWGFEASVHASRDPNGELLQYYKLDLMKTESKTVGRNNTRYPTDTLIASLLCHVKKFVTHYMLTDHLKINISDDPKLGIPHRVRWCLTVPAIWNERQKALMRKAAFEGLNPKDEDHFVMALEPEAALLFCSFREEFPRIPRSIIFVLDAGAGTIDIASYSVDSTPGQKTALKQLTRASGGACGGTFVDRELFKYLDQRFKTKTHPVSFIIQKHARKSVFLSDWELTKARFSDSSPNTDTFSVPLPPAIKTAIEEQLEEGQDSGALLPRSHLVFSRAELLSIFKNPITRTIVHVGLALVDVLKQEQVFFALEASINRDPEYTNLWQEIHKKTILVEKLQEKQRFLENFILIRSFNPKVLQELTPSFSIVRNWDEWTRIPETQQINQLFQQDWLDENSILRLDPPVFKAGVERKVEILFCTIIEDLVFMRLTEDMDKKIRAILVDFEELRKLKSTPTMVPRESKLDSLFLVGGFSNCQLLRERLTDLCGPHLHKPPIFPQKGDADKAIVHGACLSAVENRLILSRKQRYTVGVETFRLWNPEEPTPKNAKIVPVNGRKVWKSFLPFVVAGQEIPTNQMIPKTYEFKEAFGKTEVDVHIFICEGEPNRVFETAVDDLKLVCTIKLPDIPPSCDIKIDMKFGIADFVVETTTGGKALRHEIDYNVEEIKPPPDPKQIKYHVIFILDASYSMTGRPWECLNLATQTFIEKRAGRDDLCSIVLYNEDGYIIKEAKPMVPVNLVHIGGGTSFNAGFCCAEEILDRTHQLDYQKQVIFMTDGQCRDGQDKLLQIMQKFPGIDLHIAFFGHDSSSYIFQQALKDMATAAGGTYHAAFSGVELTDVFAQIAGLLLTSSLN